MTELTLSEAEDRFASELRGLPLPALSRLVVKVCSEGTRQDIYDDDDGLRADGRRPDGVIPRETIWKLDIMGVPLEMHYYVRTPAYLVLMRRDAWSLGFSTSIALGSQGRRAWVTLELDRAMLPKDGLLGMPINGPKKFRVFSIKRKGKPKAFRHDMSILRLVV